MKDEEGCPSVKQTSCQRIGYCC